MITLILHDIHQILKLQEELIKEQYLMRGELNAILDMGLGSFLPKFSFSESDFPGFPEPEKSEKEETITVEIKPE